MKAVILAAGRSTRLYPLTLEKPKSLLEVGGKALLEYQLEALAACNVEKVFVVTGYFNNLIEDKINSVREKFPFDFEFIYNPRFAETNNIYSLRTAKDKLVGEDFLCLHADVLLHPAILQNVAKSEADIALVADEEILEETMKLKFDGKRVTDVGKHIKPDEASGTFLGIAKFSKGGSKSLFDETEKLIASGELNAYFALAVKKLIEKGAAVEVSLTENLPWIEIDFPEELADAEEKVLPLLINETRSQTNG